MANILSIDWDYFMDVTEEQRFSLFPDGGNENLSLLLRDTIWKGLYSASDRLEKVGLLEDQVNELNKYLKKNVRKKTRFMIVDSHRHIYDFIKKHCSLNEPLNLFNIDQHHDVYKISNKEVHAGNWLHHIMKEYPKESSYTWIARKSSEMRKEDMSDSLKVRYETFEELRSVRWDLVFVCRSDMWSPPHLDRQFVDAFDWMITDYKVIGDVRAIEDRYSQEFLSEVEFGKQRWRNMNEEKQV